MKLRKALDKAQAERGEEWMPETAVPEGASRVGRPDNGRQEWHAPVYCRSTRVAYDADKLRAAKCVCIDSAAAELDAYKVLRAKILQQCRENGWQTMMVTSGRSAEGKTVTAINLALTVAKEFQQTVLLVDADLQKQDVARYFGFQAERGLGDYLLGECSFCDIVVWPGIEKMTIVSGGRTIEDSSELLGSPRMHELMAELKNRYRDRFIIFDLPSLLDGADALTFAPLVDSVLVVEAGRTSEQDVQKGLAQFPREKLLGCVMNRLR
ncbi:MAG: hypothetical protein A2521_02690 [Deltaproteobacteria bacterium RIFOXYD12_FULL_57_12]|nr:MAG: hypothetical protein A2521_02690 [Deltaproteobacteria bacterium RIFOXYD12_FULL_57_12]